MIPEKDESFKIIMGRNLPKLIRAGNSYRAELRTITTTITISTLYCLISLHQHQQYIMKILKRYTTTTQRYISKLQYWGPNNIS